MPSREAQILARLEGFIHVTSGSLTPADFVIVIVLVIVIEIPVFELQPDYDYEDDYDYGRE